MTVYYTISETKRDIGRKSWFFMSSSCTRRPR